MHIWTERGEYVDSALRTYIMGICGQIEVYLVKLRVDTWTKIGQDKVNLISLVK